MLIERGPMHMSFLDVLKPCGCWAIFLFYFFVLFKMADLCFPPSASMFTGWCSHSVCLKEGKSLLLLCEGLEGEILVVTCVRCERNASYNWLLGSRDTLTSCVLGVRGALVVTVGWGVRGTLLVTDCWVPGIFSQVVFWVCERNPCYCCVGCERNLSCKWLMGLRDILTSRVFGVWEETLL